MWKRLLQQISDRETMKKIKLFSNSALILWIILRRLLQYCWSFPRPTAGCSRNSTVGDSLGRVLCAPFRRPNSEYLSLSTCISLPTRGRRVKCDAVTNQSRNLELVVNKSKLAHTSKPEPGYRILIYRYLFPQLGRLLTCFQLTEKKIVVSKFYIKH